MDVGGKKKIKKNKERKKESTEGMENRDKMRTITASQLASFGLWLLSSFLSPVDVAIASSPIGNEFLRMRGKAAKSNVQKQCEASWSRKATDDI